MTKETRYLKNPPAFYEYAMQRANTAEIFNRTTLPESFHLRVFWCRYIHYSNQERIRPNSKLHSHSFFELHCILNGELLYNGSEGLDRRAAAGEFLLIAPRRGHYLTSLSPEAETFAITFEPYCQDTDDGNALQARFDSISEVIAPLTAGTCQLIELIMQEFHEGRSFCTENVKMHLNALIIDLMRSIFEGDGDTRHRDNLPARSLHDIRVRELEKYVDDNPSRLITAEELAEHLNISTRHLSNIMNTELGISPKSFIDSKKAAQARKLLLETNLPLQRVSEMLGFSEPNNFNRFFKRIEGMSPGTFRSARGS